MNLIRSFWFNISLLIGLAGIAELAVAQATVGDPVSPKVQMNPQAKPAQRLAYELRGDYEAIPVVIGDERIHFFVFTFTGNLNQKEIDAQAASVFKDLVAQGKSANRRTFRSSRTGDQRNDAAFGQKRGEILVVGAANATANTWRWWAMDTDGNESKAKHHWIDNAGGRGLIDAAKAAQEQNKYVTDWMVTEKQVKDRLAQFVLKSSAGWTDWRIYNDHINLEAFGLKP